MGKTTLAEWLATDATGTASRWFGGAAPRDRSPRRSHHGSRSCEPGSPVRRSRGAAVLESIATPVLAHLLPELSGRADVEPEPTLDCPGAGSS